MSLIKLICSNALSVIQYALDILRVRHILVVGHYGCGGVRAAMNEERHGLVDNWLRHVQDVRDRHAASLARVGDPAARRTFRAFGRGGNPGTGTRLCLRRPGGTASFASIPLTGVRSADLITGSFFILTGQGKS
jgi:hypothetical protein